MKHGPKYLFRLIIIFFLFETGISPVFSVDIKATPLTKIDNEKSGINIPWILNQGLMGVDILAYAGLFNGHVAVTKSGEIRYSISSAFERNKEAFFIEYPVNSLAGSPVPERETNAKISYFCGNVSSRWQTDMPSFRQINFGEVYDRVELKLKADAKNVEKIFLVHPGGNPSDIRMRLQGIDQILLTDDGELEVARAARIARFTKPVAYQEISGRKEHVEVTYSVFGNEYGFNLGDYDRKRTLIIDPLLASTFIGGNQREGGENNQGFDITVDKDGNIFVIGMTASLNFPISGAYCDSLTGNYDIFISKFNSDLTELLASTYIGGSGYEESWGIVIDTTGNVYATGITSSNDFPYVSGSSYDSTYAGSSDAFVIKLSNDLSALLGASYLGGTGIEQRNSMALDESGCVFIGGMTGSLNFPTTIGSYNESYNSGEFDFYVSKFNNDLTSLEASTYLGGLYHELWPDIEVDLNGNVFIAGATGSYNYPFTSGVYDDEFNGAHSYSYWNLDVVISKFNNDLSALLASTCIGSPGYEGSQYLKLDASGHVYVSGHTLSSGYPVTPGTYDVEFSGDEYFISKLDNNLTGLIASTFSSPGTSSEASFWGIAVDNQENIYTTGVIWEGDFMTTDNAYDRTYNGGPFDGIIMKFDPDLTTALYASYFGGSADEIGAAIVLRNGGMAYIAGVTASADLPIMGGVFGTYNGGTTDCFVVKFAFDQFTRITEGPHVDTIGENNSVSWIDYDNDTYPDLFLSNHMGLNQLYKNNGDGTFSIPVGNIILNDGYSVSSCWADLDNDSDLDAYVGNGMHVGVRNFYYVNNGDGTFTKNTDDIIANVLSSSLDGVCDDYNNDGNLDIFNASDMFDGNSYDQLYRGNGGGTFELITDCPMAIDASASAFAIWLDIDNDRDADLLMSKDPYETLYLNDGGEFTVVTDSNFLTVSWNMGYCAGDYDNDGDLDLYVQTWNGQNSALFMNNGNGTFEEITGQAMNNDSLWSIGSCAGDFDNDGDLDIYVANDYYETDQPDYFYINDGNGIFTPYIDSAMIDNPSGFSCKAVCADYDRDGDLDIYAINWYPDYTNCLFQNNGNSNGWITIKPIGMQSSRSALGTKIRIFANINSQPIWQMREIRSHNSPRSQNPLEAHFGLGDADIVDSIIIEWLSGMVDVYTDVAPNQFITYTETVCGDADGNFSVNLLDITYLISYLYKGGPAPVHMQAADPDGSGTINILDITYLIAYLYKGGSKPVCH